MSENKNLPANDKTHYYGPSLVPWHIYAERGERAHQENEHLRELATKDQLSGALNRHGLEMNLESAKTPVALILIDATNFKAVNDRYGHTEGDKLIIETYRILQKSTRPTDVIARWGGDEFVIVLNGADESLLQKLEIPDERRVRATPTENIDAVKERIAALVKKFREEQPHLRDVNFDLAVGADEWSGEKSVQEKISELEAELKAHKAKQHESGQYRQA